MSKTVKIRPQAALLRASVLTSVPAEPSQFDRVQPQFVYVPASHRRALDPDAMVVSGIRGAGKSFWWHALLDDALRGAIINVSLKVTAGFGLGAAPTWPDKDELAQMIAEGFRADTVWKAVILRQLSPP